MKRNRFRFLILAALGTVMLVACDSSSGGDTHDTGPSEDVQAVVDVQADVPMEGDTISGPTWTATIQPILSTYCAGCHGAGTCFSGRCFLDDHALVTGATTNPDECGAGATVAQCIPTRIEDGSMPPDGCPPGSEGCITEDELDQVKAWIENGTPE